MSKIPLQSTNLTPEQLGRHLGRERDVSILGEVHTSQAVLDMQSRIFGASRTSPLFIEGGPLTTALALKMHMPLTGANSYGAHKQDILYAHSHHIPIKGADLEPYGSAVTANLIVTIDHQLNGAATANNTAYSLAALYLKEHGIDATHFDQQRDNHNNVQIAKEFLDTYGKTLPQYLRNNLLRSASDLDHEQQTGFVPKILHEAGKISESISKSIDMHKRLKESNPVFCENIDKALTEFRKKHPHAHATLTVGMDHNEGIEANLKARGYSVGNVKIMATSDKALDGKVFHNPSADTHNQAEWVVAVYDPSKKTTRKFEKHYSINENSEAQVKHDKAGPSIDPSKDLSASNSGKQR